MRETSLKSKKSVLIVYLFKKKKHRLEKRINLIMKINPYHNAKMMRWNYSTMIIKLTKAGFEKLDNKSENFFNKNINFE